MLVQIPPPIHGSSLVSQSIVTSDYIASHFALDVLDISTARTFDAIGSLSLRKIIESILLIGSLIVRLLRERYDVIYITITPHGSAFYKDSILALISSILGSQVVYHLHGKGISTEIHKSCFRGYYYRVIFNNVKVIQLSPRLYADIEELVPPENVYFLPNGVRSQREARVDEKTVHVKTRILYLSNMVASKGAMVLLKALGDLRERGYHFEALFAGSWGRDDSFRDDFLEFIKKNHLEGCVNYVGPVYGKEKKRLLNSVDVFVLPTYFRYECFPLAILEAMSCGLPVIATYEGAIPEIVDDGETGFLVKQESTRELVEKLQRCLDDGEMRKRLGRAGRRKYSAEYTMQVFEERFVQTLQQIINDFRKSGR